MKQSFLLKTLVAVVLVFAGLSSGAQSISGNIKGFESSTSLGFATVDIYKSGTLVASVLADASGNFNVSLDTGHYTCEIQYAGYHKITQEFKVTDDEKAIFNLKEDKDSKYRTPPKMEYEEEADAIEVGSRGMISEPTTVFDGGSRERRHKSKDMRSYTPGDDMPQVGSGVLTAGEVNDFAKWTLWSDLTEGELMEQQRYWDIAPTQRYMVEVMNKKGLPLVNAKLKLFSAGKVIFEARSDNTGKAELWGKYRRQSNLAEEVEITVEYKGDIKKLKSPKTFGAGNNRVEFKADCKQTEVVDIAFVVDATGSMSDELNFLKAELNDVVFKAKEISKRLNLRFANVFYRDQGDAYVTKTMPFSRVLTESTAFISQQHAAGGGDHPEAVDVALDSALHKLEWSEEARARLLFLVLDAPPHEGQEMNTKLIKLSKEAAAKGVRIIPITASGVTKSLEYLMRSMALMTNGTYSFLTNHSGVGGDHIEPSTDSYDVEKLNDLMVRLIKSYTVMPDCEQNYPELDLPYSDTAVVVPVKDSTNNDTLEGGIQTSLKWNFYPNPTRGIVNIESNKDIKELFITDLSGKLIRRIERIQANRVVQTDLSGYSAGIYLIRYPIGQQWVSGKIVLVK